METMVKTQNVQELKEHFLKHRIKVNIKKLNKGIYCYADQYRFMHIPETNIRNFIKAFKYVGGINEHALNDNIFISNNGIEKRVFRYFRRGVKMDNKIYNSLTPLITDAAKNYKVDTTFLISLIWRTIEKNNTYCSFTYAGGGQSRIYIHFQEHNNK